MFPSILWSSWEAETCQLSTRPHLDASEQRGGRASPQQDPRPPLPLPTGLAFPSPGTREPASGQWGLPSCTPGSFLFLLRSVLHEASGESSLRGPSGGRATMAGHHVGRGRADSRLLACPCVFPPPLPPCSRITQTEARASHLPAGATPEQPSWFCPQGKKD